MSRLDDLEAKSFLSSTDDHELDEGSGITKQRHNLCSNVIRSALALVLICMGFLLGRYTVPSPGEMDSLGPYCVFVPVALPTAAAADFEQPSTCHSAHPVPQEKV